MNKIRFIKLMFSLVILLLLAEFSFADTIYLKSGKTVEGQIVEATDKYIKMDVGDIIVTFFKDEIKEVSLLKNNSQLDTEKQQVLEFINKLDSIQANCNGEVFKKTLLLASVLAVGNKQEGYRIEREMRDLTAQHRQQIESLTTPVICSELKTVLIKSMQLQEEQHDALSKGNVQEGKLLAQQVVEYLSKIKSEAERVVKHYER